MRILIVVHGYPPTYHGGAERRAARTARGLARQKHEVRVLCVESSSPDMTGCRWDDEIQDGVTVRRLHISSSSRDPLRWSYDNPITEAATSEIIQDWRPDILHLFSGYLMSASAVRAGVELDVPVVVSLTDYWWFCHRITLLRPSGARCDGPHPIDCARCHAERLRRFRLPALRWPGGARALWGAVKAIPPAASLVGATAQERRAELLTGLLDETSALISPSRYLADFYIRHGMDPKRMRVWRQGVDLPSRPDHVPSPEVRFSYIGQVKWHKGVDLLLEAWSLLRGTIPRKLCIYGSDAGEERFGYWLRQESRGLTGVEWAGYFQGSEVWGVLANSDALVVPSRWIENSPNSILEAQAMGVPVIASNLGGNAELVSHGHNGLLFESDSARDLASQMQRALDEPQFLAQCRRSCIKVRSVDEEVSEISDLYHELALPPMTPHPPQC